MCVIVVSVDEVWCVCGVEFVCVMVMGDVFIDGYLFFMVLCDIDYGVQVVVVLYVLN